MPINKIDDETINKIKNKSVMTLSNNPSERGLSPQKIKEAMVKPLLDSDTSVVTEINRIVDEINTSTGGGGNRITESSNEPNEANSGDIWIEIL